MKREVLTPAADFHDDILYDKKMWPATISRLIINIYLLYIIYNITYIIKFSIRPQNNPHFERAVACINRYSIYADLTHSYSSAVRFYFRLARLHFASTRSATQ